MDDAAFSAWLDRGVQTWGGWLVLAVVVWFYGGKLFAWLRLPPLGAIASFVGSMLSSLLQKSTSEITSSPRPSEPSAPAVQRTDTPPSPPAPAIFAPTYAQTFDGCKLMRGYGLTREQAREVVKAFGGAFPNDLWTQVAPPPTEGQTVTPIAGRTTKARFEYDDPALNYAEPTT